MIQNFLLTSGIVRETDEDKREVTAVPLKPEARRFVEKIREDTGVPKVEAMTRILEWFSSLDRKFRLAVLNRDEETKRELTRLVLQQMAAEPTAQEHKGSRVRGQ